MFDKGSSRRNRRLFSFSDAGIAQPFIEELTLTYPIETVRGRYGGGVRMADWYFQDRPKLTPKQTALLKRLAIGLHGEDLDEMNRILTHFAS